MAARRGPAPEPTRSELWHGVDRLIDRAGSLDDLRAHGLHLLAAERWRAIGREAPASLAMEELIALKRTADALEIIRLARDAYDGSIVVLKGPELASRYPSPFLRPFGDIDLLVDEPERAQAALISAGFEAIGSYGDDYYEGLQHLRPLRLPERLPIVEVHRRPNWVDWFDPPSTGELLAAAVPSVVGIEGVHALPPSHHALAIAAHSWGERPLRRILDLIDVALLAGSADRHEIDALAARWGLSRIWRTTIEAADALIFESESSSALSIWARELRTVRSRTVMEDHLRRWLSPFWALPAHRAAVASLVAIGRGFVPAPGETWANKLTRTREAITHPRRSTEAHRRQLGPQAIQPWLKRRS